MSCDTSCSGVSKYHVGDVGTEVLVNVCVDITTATLTRLDVRKPDGTEVQWVGAVYDTTYIRYVTQSGDFDQAGEYRVNPYVEMPGWEGFGDTDTFKVYEVGQ